MCIRDSSALVRKRAVKGLNETISIDAKATRTVRSYSGRAGEFDRFATSDTVDAEGATTPETLRHPDRAAVHTIWRAVMGTRFESMRPPKEKAG